MTNRRDVDEHLIPWSVYRERILRQNADDKNNEPMINPALKDCLERIAMIAEAILQEANRSIKSGDVDEWAMDTFKQARAIKEYRKWIKGILSANTQYKAMDNNQQEEVQ